MVSFQQLLTFSARMEDDRLYIRQITLLSKAAVTVISKCLLHSLFTAQFLHHHSRLFATKRWSVSKNYSAAPLLPASTSLNQQKQAALHPFSDFRPAGTAPLAPAWTKFLLLKNSVATSHWEQPCQLLGRMLMGTVLMSQGWGLRWCLMAWVAAGGLQV